jgi:flagella basal body P-ring formation protein FlgA
MVCALLLGIGSTAVSGGAPAIPKSLEKQVRERLAGEWSVRPESVLLQWGDLSDSLSRDGEVPFRLLGKGGDGRFVLTTQSVEGRTVALALQAGVLDTVMVAARSLRIGARIDDGDIRPETMPVWGPPAPLLAAPGWEVLRALAVGEIVASPAAAPPVSVERGEPVRFEWERGGIRVTIAGIALHSARIGEPVRARVPGRHHPVEGIVTGLGLATLRMERTS